MKTKTKLTIAVASVLSVAALAGTGYAGWVLSHNVEGNAQGNMTAYGVADKTVKLSEIVFKDKKDSIVWGKTNKADGVDGTWFGYTSGEVDGVADEFFTPVLSFTITNTDETDDAIPVIEEATITVTDENGHYNTCLTAGLINGPAVGSHEKIKLPTPVKTEKKNVFTCEMNLVDATTGAAFFGWGSHFAETGKNPVNPINFYNSKNANDTNPDTSKPWYADAQDTMGKIELLKDVHFDIRFVVNHAAL